MKINGINQVGNTPEQKKTRKFQNKPVVEQKTVQASARDASAVYGRASVNIKKTAFESDGRDGQIGKDDEEFARFIEYLDKNIPHSKRESLPAPDNSDISESDCHDGSYGKD